MRQLIREGKSASKALQAQIDRAVALADQEIGIRAEGSFDPAGSRGHPLPNGESCDSFIFIYRPIAP